MTRVFLSYARDDFDNDLEEFLTDLRKNVASATNLPKDSIIFRDYDSIPLGEEWSPALTAGIASCTLFVSVYSPRYLGSAYCGKEWSAFQERVATASDPKRAKRCHIPLWWNPLDSSIGTIPEEAAKHQDTTAPLPPEYREAGMRALKMTRSKPEYNKAMLDFAGLIARALKTELTSGVTLGKLDPEQAIDTYPNAFAPKVPSNDTAPLSTRDPGRGVQKRVWFGVVAGTKADMRGVRGDLNQYEDDPTSWSPYDPQYPIYLDLMQAALAERVAADVWEMPADLQTELAQKARHPVIVVVDPWSVSLPRYKQTMLAFDSHFSANVGAVVPVLERDEAARDSTFESLFKTRLAGVDSDTFCYPLKSRDDLISEVRRLIAQLQQRIIKTMLPPRGSSFPKRHVLRGPG